MANTIQLGKVYRDYLQENLYNSTVALKSVADTRATSDLKYGKTVDWFTMDKLTVNPYTVNTDVTLQNVVTGTDTLTVDKQYESSVTLDIIEETQANFPLLSSVSMEQAKALAQQMDVDILKATTVAPSNANAFDNGDLTAWVSDGTPITVTPSNTIDLFSRVRAKLGKRGVNGKLIAVIPYYFASYVEQEAASSGFSVADSALRNGFAGSWMGYDIYVSENLDAATDTRTHCYFGMPGMISVAKQIDIAGEITEIPLQFAHVAKSLMVYGVKAFTRNRSRFLDVQIDTL